MWIVRITQHNPKQTGAWMTAIFPRQLNTFWGFDFAMHISGVQIPNLSRWHWMSRDWCHFGINIPHQTTVNCTVDESFFCHIQRLEIFGLPCHLGWGPHMWHYKYMGLLCANLSRVDLTTKKASCNVAKVPVTVTDAPYTWNPRMKIPSLCTWTIVADNTSCQPLWKKNM